MELQVSGTLQTTTSPPPSFTGCRIEALFNRRVTRSASLRSRSTRTERLEDATLTPTESDLDLAAELLGAEASVPSVVEEPSKVSALSDAAGKFTLVFPEKRRITSEKVKIVVSSPADRIIAEKEIMVAELGPSITVEVENFETTSSDNPTPQLRELRAAIDASFHSEANLRKALTENLKPLRAESEAIANRIQRAFAEFKPSQLSVDELARRHYVAPGADPGEVLETAIMSRVDVLRADKTERALTLRNDAELKKLIKNNQEESVQGVVELGPLLEFVQRRGSGPFMGAELTSMPYRAEAEAEAILIAVGSSDGGGVGDLTARREALSSDTSDAEEFVKDKVNLQMKTATAPESQLAYGKIPNSADEDKVQSDILQSFQLRQGASDVTSYHDFHTLQIAFEHVWTEIFDGQLTTLGRDLYREYVKLKDFSGSGQPDLQVSTIADLRRLMEEIKKLSQIVQEDVPSDLRGGGGSKSDTIKGKDDFVETAVRVGIGVATGGLSELIKLAVDKIRNAGRKPVLNWDHLDGRPLPGNKDTFVYRLSGGAPAHHVKIALQTDDGSHRKILEFQPYNSNTGNFINNLFRVSNAGHPEAYITEYLTLPASLMETGVIEFASQETATIDLGRYVLEGLQQKLVSETSVVFHWRD